MSTLGDMAGVYERARKAADQIQMERTRPLEEGLSGQAKEAVARDLLALRDRGPAWQALREVARLLRYEIQEQMLDDEKEEHSRAYYKAMVEGVKLFMGTLEALTDLAGERRDEEIEKESSAEGVRRSIQIGAFGGQTSLTGLEE